MSTTFVVGKIDNRKCKIGTGALVEKKRRFLDDGREFFGNGRFEKDGAKHVGALECEINNEEGGSENFLCIYVRDLILQM